MNKLTIWETNTVLPETLPLGKVIEIINTLREENFQLRLKLQAEKEKCPVHETKRLNCTCPKVGDGDPDGYYQSKLDRK